MTDSGEKNILMHQYHASTHKLIVAAASFVFAVLHHHNFTVKHHKYFFFDFVDDEWP